MSTKSLDLFKVQMQNVYVQQFLKPTSEIKENSDQFMVFIPRSLKHVLMNGVGFWNFSFWQTANPEEAVWTHTAYKRRKSGPRLPELARVLIQRVIVTHFGSTILAGTRLCAHASYLTNGRRMRQWNKCREGPVAIAWPVVHSMILLLQKRRENGCEQGSSGQTKVGCGESGDKGFFVWNCWCFCWFFFVPLCHPGKDFVRSCLARSSRMEENTCTIVGTLCCQAKVWKGGFPVRSYLARSSKMEENTRLLVLCVVNKKFKKKRVFCERWLHVGFMALTFLR